MLSGQLLEYVGGQYGGSVVDGELDMAEMEEMQRRRGLLPIRRPWTLSVNALQLLNHNRN